MYEVRDHTRHLDIFKGGRFLYDRRPIIELFATMLKHNILNDIL
jgi:hypothetical protein